MDKLKKLEQAAVGVLDELKRLPELQSARVVIVGGMAVCKYLPHHRTTQDIDFVVAGAGDCSSITKKLMRLPNTPFKQTTFEFIYKNEGLAFQVDILNIELMRYPPPARTLVEIGALMANEIPYISEVDLLVRKIYLCGCRTSLLKKKRDATDIYHLLVDLHKQTGDYVPLAADQKEHSDRGISNVIEYCEFIKDKES
jgi:hypothetical protein